MKKMMSFSGTNGVLGTSLSPGNRCIWKQQALDAGADPTPINSSPYDNFAYNRLLPVEAVTKVVVTTYTVIFVNWDGTELLRYTDVTMGQSISAPTATRSGHDFTGWYPSFSGTVTGNVTYTAQFTAKPGDLVHDDAGNMGEDVAKTMDQVGLEYAEEYPTPTTSISQWAPSGGHWWHGPVSGTEDDKYGERNGISATAVSGRLKVRLWSNVWIDSCIYEYADIDVNSGEYGVVTSTSNIGDDDLINVWVSPNGKFKIRSNDNWIKFVICKVDWTYDDYPVNFAIYYFVINNDYDEPRHGTVTVTTSGGTCNYNCSPHNQKNKPYMTVGTVHFYQLGRAD